LNPAAVIIKTLTDFDPDDLRRLGGGYASTARYEVRKTETHEHTAITLNLVPLETPYVRQWPYDDEDTLRYTRLVREEGLSLGAYDGGQMVGIAIAEAIAWNRSLWVWEVHVDPAYRQQGIGRRLLDTLAAKGRAAGLQIMVCETQNTNVPAILFYRKVGFALDGIDLSYYAGAADEASRSEIALFMKRRL
jgi:ribosomal protein S18 acetylase RimI-like enzyme